MCCGENETQRLEVLVQSKKEEVSEAAEKSFRERSSVTRQRTDWLSLLKYPRTLTGNVGESNSKLVTTFSKK